jgi:hypothetical protein
VLRGIAVPAIINTPPFEFIYGTPELFRPTAKSDPEFVVYGSRTKTGVFG